MKTQRFLTVLTLAAALLAGCSKSNLSEDAAPGGLALTISGIEDNLTVKSSAGTDNLDLNSFIITFTSPESSAYRLEYTVADFNETYSDGLIPFYPGDYTVKVTSPDNANAEWDQPIYGCTEDFSIVSEKVTTLDLVCTIQNMKVTVVVTDAFKDEFYEYNVVVTGTYDGVEESLTWTPELIEAGAAAYFAVSELKVYVKGVRQTGNTVSEQMTITDTAPADHHIITIDATKTGTAATSIRLDDSVNDVEQDILIPGFETPTTGDDEPEDNNEDNNGDNTEDNNGDSNGDSNNENSTAPTATWATNPDFEPMYLAEEMAVDIVVSAPEGIASFLVGVDSATLSTILDAVGITLPMDIINDENATSLLGELGVPVGEDLVGATTVDFDISNLAPLIYALSPDALSEHVFTLIVTDKKDQKLERTITFIMPEE